MRAWGSICRGELLAVKQIYIQEELERGNDVSSLCMTRMLSLAKIEREAGVTRLLQHPNVVRFLGSGSCAVSADATPGSESEAVCVRVQSNTAPCSTSSWSFCRAAH